jgi:hypothetical protein
MSKPQPHPHLDEAVLRQHDELLEAVHGLLGLIEIADGRDDMPLKLAANHRYIDALALVQRIRQIGSSKSL